jgi:hypothetical protein
MIKERAQHILNNAGYRLFACMCALLVYSIFFIPTHSLANPGKTTTCLDCHTTNDTTASIYVAVDGAEHNTASNYVLSSYTGVAQDVEIDYYYTGATNPPESISLWVNVPSGWAVAPGTVNSPTGTNFGASWSSAWDVATSNGGGAGETYYAVATGDPTYYPNSPDSYSIYWNDHAGSLWDNGKNSGARDDGVNPGTTPSDRDGWADTMGTDFLITVPAGLGAGTTHEIIVMAIGHDSVNARAYSTTTLTIQIPGGDTDPPTFGGITGATDAGTGGTVDLTWSAATDPSTPITYNIYWSTTPGGQNFGGAPNDTSSSGTGDTVSGLADDQIYYFVVRAEDSVGNEDTNTTEQSDTPTAPSDTDPPTFGGVTGATDATTGGTVDLTWSAATDPSTPITYNIYWATTPGGQNFGTPDQTSSSGTGDSVTGLTNDQIYYFVVRAEDSATNEDTNTTEQSATPTAPPSCEYFTPTVTILTAGKDITFDGGLVKYTVRVNNNDSAPCSPTNFSLTVADDNGTNFYPSTADISPLNVAPQSFADTTIQVTAQPNQTDGLANDTHFYTEADGNHAQSANSTPVTTTIQVSGVGCVTDGSLVNGNGDQFIISR